MNSRKKFKNSVFGLKCGNISIFPHLPLIVELGQFLNSLLVGNLILIFEDWRLEGVSMKSLTLGPNFTKFCDLESSLSRIPQ